MNTAFLSSMRFLSVALLSVFICSWAQAGTELNQLVLESTVGEDLANYRILKKGSQFYISHFSSSDPDKSPSQLQERAVEDSQVQFIQGQVDEILKLKDAGKCAGREISLSVQVGEKSNLKKGCVNAGDPLSERLRQLTGILAILE